MLELEQTGGAHRRGVGVVVHRELDDFGLALSALLDVLLHPLLLALRGRDAEVIQAAADLGYISQKSSGALTAT